MNFEQGLFHCNLQARRLKKNDCKLHNIYCHTMATPITLHCICIQPWWWQYTDLVFSSHESFTPWQWWEASRQCLISRQSRDTQHVMYQRTQASASSRSWGSMPRSWPRSRPRSRRKCLSLVGQGSLRQCLFCASYFIAIILKFFSHHKWQRTNILHCHHTPSCISLFMHLVHKQERAITCCLGYFDVWSVSTIDPITNRDCKTARLLKNRFFGFWPRQNRLTGF